MKTCPTDYCKSLKLCLALFIFLALVAPAHSQFSNLEIPLTRKKKKPLFQPNFHQVQGALVLDKNRSLDYSGINYLSWGMGRLTENTMQGFELEGLIFKKKQIDPVKLPSNSFSIPVGWERLKKSFGLAGYKIFQPFPGEKFRFFAGPLISIGYANDRLIPTNSLVFPFPSINNDIRLGLGVKASAYLKINSKLYLNFGSKFILIEAGFNRLRIENPVLTIRQQKNYSFRIDALRSIFYFPFGITLLLDD